MLRPNNRNRLFVIPTIALVVAGALVYAQQKPPAKQSDDGSLARFSTDVRRVVCNATVVDKAGHLVTDLPRGAFTVLENGQAQSILSFKREDVPVSLGLVIDNSGSMRDKRAKVAAASLALVKDSNKDDEVFVVNFNDEAFLDLPHQKDFTNDITELEEALSRIDSRGGTAMRDAIRMSIDHLKEKGHRSKKVLVVVTDGDDNSSVISLENLVRASQQSEVLIYAVGLLSDEEKRAAARAKRALIDLTTSTGGDSFFPRELAEVDRIAHQVAHDIRNQYTIVYSPSNQAMDGTYRKIQINVSAAGKPTVRTRSGYYATPDSAPPPKGASSLIKQ